MTHLNAEINKLLRLNTEKRKSKGAGPLHAGGNKLARDGERGAGSDLG